MLQRRDDMAVWQSVTGCGEPGDSLARSAQREVQEDTGIDVNAAQLTIVDCQR
ncbi:NUDIX domain-containing protein, partial [Erwinia amylovora]|uniref:NUDIX domain-containing protein n=1 Tax=Erwinia amylovora TaxID=552 RepID=UPI00200B6D0D